MELFKKGFMDPISNNLQDADKEAREKYRTWLLKRYSECVEITFSFLSNAHSTTLQGKSIRSLFELLSKMKDANKYDENEILLKIVEGIFKKDENDPLSEECRMIFYNEYYTKYEDIKYYTLKYYNNILEKVSSSLSSTTKIENPKKKRKLNKDNNNNEDIYDIEKIFEFGYKLLTIKQTILKEDEKPNTLVDLPENINRKALKFLSKSSFKSIYSSCWISYLSLPLSQV